MKRVGEKYYNDFLAHKYFDYSNFSEAINFGLEDAPEIKSRLKNEEKLAIAVCGTADPSAVEKIVNLDKLLRGEDSVKKDTVTVFDINQHPLKNLDVSPEIKQHVVQADMTQLGLAKEKFNLVLSDFTLNFLETREEIDKSLSEISRILIPGGLFICRFSGVSKGKDLEKANFDPLLSPRELVPRRRNLRRLFFSKGSANDTMEIPYIMVEEIAEQYGLKIVNFKSREPEQVMAQVDFTVIFEKPIELEHKENGINSEKNI